MMIIEKIRHRYDPYIGDAQPIVADLIVSTAAELPALGAKIGTLYAAAAGTRADVIHTGMRYTLDADGKWYTSDVYETKSVSGGEITFTGTGTPLIDYTIRGNCVQDGTPTLEEPVWPKSFGVSKAFTIALEERLPDYQGEITITVNGEKQVVPFPVLRPLMAVGGVADEMNFAAQTITRKVGRISFSGDLDEFKRMVIYATGKRSTPTMKYIFVLFPKSWDYASNIMLCSHYAAEDIDRDQQDSNLHFCYDSIGDPTRLGFSSEGSYSPSISDSIYQRWCSIFTEQAQKTVRYFIQNGNMPVTVFFPLKPEFWTTEHIELPEIPTVRGENTVTVTGGDFDISPSGIDIAYR